MGEGFRKKFRLACTFRCFRSAWFRGGFGCGLGRGGRREGERGEKDSVLARMGASLFLIVFIITLSLTD